MRIGNVEMKVVDNTDQDQLSGSRAVYYYYDNYQSFHLYNAGWHLGTPVGVCGTVGGDLGSPRKLSVAAVRCTVP